MQVILKSQRSVFSIMFSQKFFAPHKSFLFGTYGFGIKFFVFNYLDYISSVFTAMYIFTTTSIPRMLKVVNFTQICASIVEAISIDVVNFFIGKTHQKSMQRNQLFINNTTPISGVFWYMPFMTLYERYIFNINNQFATFFTITIKTLNECLIRLYNYSIGSRTFTHIQRAVISLKSPMFFTELFSMMQQLTIFHYTFFSSFTHTFKYIKHYAKLQHQL